MINKILFIILAIIILVYVLNNYSQPENFRGANPEYPPYVERKAMPGTQKVIPQNRATNKLQNKILKDTLEDKTLVNKTLNYNQILLDQSADLTYFENNVLNQSNIYEDAYDVVNQIDLVDYGDVTTGMEKCKLSCNGLCLELGYTGSASCFPKAPKFDYGTLYKNPTFTYGIDQQRFVKV